MRAVRGLMLLVAVTCASAGVGPGSEHPDDAGDIAGYLGDYLGTEPLVSLAGPDSALVLFVSMGGQWRNDEAQWTELMLISSCAVYMERQRDWQLADIAVSFGDTWCRIPPGEVRALAVTDPESWSPAEAFRSFTEVRPMDREVPDTGS